MRHWALTICVACILVGALELLLPRQESFKSIKTVLALYILLSVLSPVKQVDWSGLAGAAQTAAAQPADYSAYVDGYARSELEAQLRQSLSGAGIEGDVQVRRQENGISVTVQADQPDEACRIVQNALGTAENVSVRAEEKQQ